LKVNGQQPEGFDWESMGDHTTGRLIASQLPLTLKN